MKSLVKFEFLKILRKKSTLIVMAVSLLITAVFFILPILQFQIYNQDGVLRGLEGIAYEKEQYAEISVPLTNEYVTEQIREVQELFADPDNIGYDGNEKFLIEDAYWNGIAPREDLLALIAKNYAEPNVSVGYNALPDLGQHRTIAEASAVELPIRQETIGFPAHFFARAHNFKPPGRACQPEADSPMRT